MKTLLLKLHIWWSLLRRLSGDDAYERYLDHWRRHHAADDTPPDRATFMQQETERRWNGPKRCC